MPTTQPLLLGVLQVPGLRPSSRHVLEAGWKIEESAEEGAGIRMGWGQHRGCWILFSALARVIPYRLRGL
jgi:hypothetical protein